MYFLNPSVTVGMMNNLEWTGNAINVYAEATLCHFDISGSTGMGGGLPLSFLERGLPPLHTLGTGGQFFVQLGRLQLQHSLKGTCWMISTAGV